MAILFAKFCLLSNYERFTVPDYPLGMPRISQAQFHPSALSFYRLIHPGWGCGGGERKVAFFSNTGEGRCLPLPLLSPSLHSCQHAEEKGRYFWMEKPGCSLKLCFPAASWCDCAEWLSCSWGPALMFVLRGPRGNCPLSFFVPTHPHFFWCLEC